MFVSQRIGKICVFFQVRLVKTGIFVTLGGKYELPQAEDWRFGSHLPMAYHVGFFMG
jgi:hypothetical protein